MASAVCSGWVPVAEHHRVATGVELAGRPVGNALARRRVGDLDLDVWVGSTDRGDPDVQRVIGLGLGGERGGLGHAVADRHLGHAIRCTTCFMTSTRHGDPAIIPVRNEVRSYDQPSAVVSSSTASSAMNIAGTP